MTTRLPSIDGWFSTGERPRLLGQRCDVCGTYVFPPDATICPNPACTSQELAGVELSDRGRIWSFTTNHYAPPAPYVSPDPFVPYSIVAVELDAESMIVLGQLSASADPSTLRVGDEVELTIETLFTDDDGDHLIYRWRPA